MTSKTNSTEQQKSPLYLSLKLFIDNEWAQLSKDQIEPWYFMTVAKPFKCKNFFGKEISYQGVTFEGSPSHVFWGGYIEPFLKDIIEKSVNKARELSVAKGADLRQPLNEIEELLKNIVVKTYQMMADVDRRLLGGGNPHSVNLRNTDQQVNQMCSLVSERISAELKTWKPTSRLSDFYNRHPFWFWLIGAVLVVVGIVVAAK